MPSGISPASSAVIWVVPPLNGTMPIFTPAIMLSSSIATCEVGVELPIRRVPGFAFSIAIISATEFGWDVEIGDQHRGHVREQRDRNEVLVGVVGQLAVEKWIHHQRAVDRHQERVAVRVGLGDDLRADDRVGARPVVDDDRLAEFVGELLADEAGEEIRRPARRERDDQADRARRIGLGSGRLGCGRKAGQQHDDDQQGPFHARPSRSVFATVAGSRRRQKAAVFPGFPALAESAKRPHIESAYLHS